MNWLKTAPLLLAIAAIAACAPGGPAVDEAWIRTPLPGKSMTAGYFTLRNDSDTDIVLTGASSDRWADVSLHETRTTDGVSRMHAIDSLTLRPGEQLHFQPGGLHLMLMRPGADVASGDAIGLTLHFADGSSLQATAVVRDLAP